MFAHGLDCFSSADNCHAFGWSISSASFHIRPGSYRNRHADHPHYRTILCTLYLHRNIVQFPAWYGQRGRSYVDDLRWCLRTAYFVDLHFCKNPFEHYNHFDELPYLLGFYSSTVYHLFHVLSKEILPSLYGRNRSSCRNKRIKKRQTNLGASS